MNKACFSFIAQVQESFLALSLALLVLLPISFAYFSESIPSDFTGFLYQVSLTAVFLVMLVRPLADIFSQATWLRSLVILRKGFGVFSAAIIVSFMLAKFMIDPAAYLTAFFSVEHWSLSGYQILAPLGDVSALILLITSNRFSKRVLGTNWKRVQKLAYVYFYAGALYEYLVLNQTFALVFAIIVAIVTVTAFLMKRLRGVAIPA